MTSLKKFASNITNQINKNNKFIQFIITNNKPVLSEIILSELLNCQLFEKSKTLIRLSALDHIKTAGEKKIFF